jgi:hypothetical protein
MKPQLVPHWRHVLKRAWSVRLSFLCLLIIIAEPIYNFVAATWVAHNVYIQLSMSVVTGLLTAAAIGARVTFQQKLSQEHIDAHDREQREIQERRSSRLNGRIVGRDV